MHIIDNTKRVAVAGGLAALALLATGGCSSQQAYGVGQAWQRNECYKLAEMNDRQRCLKEADRSYDSYQKDTESLGTATKP